jgi:hypothetical protein
MRPPHFSAFACAAGLALSCAHGATGGAPAQSLSVKYEYVPPSNPAHEQIRERMQQLHLLEHLAEAFSVLRLPRTLTLRFRGCDGTSNAWYDPRDASVDFCYEYVAEIDRLAANNYLGQVPISDATNGPVLFIFLHETGHAVFNLLQVPIMGHEEDAADNFATILLLRLGPELAFHTLSGTAWMYHLEARTREPDESDYSDEHSLDAQRYYNILCLAYGSDPIAQANLVDYRLLPADRAPGCADEYTAALYAMKKLVAPAISPGKEIEYRSRLGKTFSTQL